MTKIGPFWRKRPTSYTTFDTYGWCTLWLNSEGNVIAQEWH
jgi:hypothetical protein